MTLKRFSHLLLAATLLVVTPFARLQRPALAQSTTQGAGQTVAVNAPDLSARLAAIEQAIEEKRKQYHIPGVSLVIVLDDKVIYLKGLGLKDVERNLPATIDDYFNGQSGIEVASYAPPEVKAGKSLAGARVAADFYGPLN